MYFASNFRRAIVLGFRSREFNPLLNDFSDKNVARVPSELSQQLRWQFDKPASRLLFNLQRHGNTDYSSSSSVIIRSMTPKPALPEGRIAGVEAERREQFGMMLGAAGREHGEIALGEAFGGVLVDGVERIHQAIAERIGVNVERRMDEMRDIGPEMSRSRASARSPGRGFRAARRAIARRCARPSIRRSCARCGRRARTCRTRSAAPRY